jgi:O-antigen ligase
VRGLINENYESGIHTMLKRIFCPANSANISLFFIGLMFFLPFVIMHHSLPIPLFYSEWIAGTLGLLAVMPLLRSASRHVTLEQSIKIPQISLVFIGLAIILCAQWALGMLHSTQYALLVLSYFAWAFLLVVLGSHLRQELGWGKLVTALAWGLVIGGMVNVGIVTLQFVTRTGGAIPWLPNLVSYGAIAQANHFADFTALATASLIYLYAKGRFSLSFFALILMCFLMMLSFSGSRSAWLYLAALTILAVCLYVSTRKQQDGSIAIRSIFRIGLLLIPAFILVQAFIYYVIPNNLVSLPTERLVESANVSGTSIRLSVLYDSLRLFIQSPWLGIGIGEMRAETFLLLDTPTSQSFNRPFEHTHNLFSHLLAEMGIGAFLIVLMGLIVWFRAIKWSKLNLETWWLFSLLAILGIHSMLEYPLWFAYFLGITAVLLGAGDARTVSIPLPSNIKLGRKALGASIAVILLLGIVNLATLFTANMKLEKWVEQFRYKGINDQKLIDWPHQNSLLSTYADLLSVMSMSVSPTDIDKKVLLSQSVLRITPLLKVAYQHALLLKLQGDNANAEKYLNRALIAYPRSTKVILQNIPLEYRQDYLDLLSKVRPNQKK